MMETPYLSVFKDDVAELDRILLGCALFLAGCGVLCVFSAGAGRMGRGWDFALRQSLWLAAGCLAMFFMVAVGYRRLLDAAYPIYGLTLFLLFLTVLLAPRIKGAQSWLSLGFFRFQPSEFAKISLILMLSTWRFRPSSWCSPSRIREALWCTSSSPSACSSSRGPPCATWGPSGGWA